MVSKFQFTTIQDMERRFYGGATIRKDAPVISTTTGVNQTVYGAQVWAQLNREANLFSATPKYVWTRSGWRLITARAAASGGGVAENGDLPATIKPTWTPVSATPKSIAHAFDVSEVQDFLATESMDDAVGGMADMRIEMGIHHKEMMNIMLLADTSAEAAAAGADRTAADKYNFETIDRIVSNDSEEDAFGGTYNNWFDIYGLDRDSGTIYDAYVDHNSGTDRVLSDSIIRTTFDSVQELGSNCGIEGQGFVLTGTDTKFRTIGLYDGQVRYDVIGAVNGSIGVNGVSTDAGIGVGIKVATLYTAPFIISKNVTKDTISRMYFLDATDPEGFGVPRLGLMMAKPTEYFEAGIATGTPHAVNRLGNEGLFRTMGEIVCRRLDVQGKVRDLK